MTGLRNPTLYEMFGTDNFGYSGNTNLKPEKSNTYEYPISAEVVQKKQTAPKTQTLEGLGGDAKPSQLEKP